ncbi:hypothetical protein PoB_006537600 [Plakobranchus ocellatus]|uniref:Uncharacterized protein n=1 Tax=Plakobranchus ocellatus TaxID=259542 RepID=A0AAV4D458_9GAST|nr:hypothetical protein PoB_006537600 [Plakobranchus ocellatus]
MGNRPLSGQGGGSGARTRNRRVHMQILGSGGGGGGSDDDDGVDADDDDDDGDDDDDDDDGDDDDDDDDDEMMMILNKTIMCGGSVGGRTIGRQWNITKFFPSGRSNKDQGLNLHQNSNTTKDWLGRVQKRGQVMIK